MEQKRKAKRKTHHQKEHHTDLLYFALDSRLQPRGKHQDRVWLKRFLEGVHARRPLGGEHHDLACDREPLELPQTFPVHLHHSAYLQQGAGDYSPLPLRSQDISCSHQSIKHFHTITNHTIFLFFYRACKKKLTNKQKSYIHRTCSLCFKKSRECSNKQTKTQFYTTHRHKPSLNQSR